MLGLLVVLHTQDELSLYDHTLEILDVSWITSADRSAQLRSAGKSFQ
jgi:hypothetical protein